MRQWSQMLRGLGRAGEAEAIRQDAEELEEHAIQSIRHSFGEKRLSIRTMDPPLRLGTGILAACLLATVAAIALRDVGGGGVFLGESGGAVTAISTPAFVVALVLISIGFGYVFTAVTDAGPVIAFPTIGVLLFLVGLYTGAFGSLIGGLDYSKLLPQWTSWLTRGILAAVLVVAGAVQLFDRARKNPRSRSVRLEILALYSVLIGSYFFVIRAGSPTVGHLNLYGPVVAAILGYLSFVLYPILQVVAVDFGEWGEIAGHRLAFVVKDRARAMLGLGLAATIAMSVYGASQVVRTSPHAGSLLRAVAVGTCYLAVMLGVMAWLVALFKGRWRSRPKSFNFAGLVGVCALVFVLVPPLALYLSGGISSSRSPLTERGRFAPGADVISVSGASGPGSFSFQVPRGWLVAKRGSFVLAVDNGPHHSYERVEAGLFPVQIPLSTVIQGLKVAAAGPASRSAGWERVAVRQKGADGLLWVRAVSGSSLLGTYFVYEVAAGEFKLATSRPLFAAIVSSFRGGGAHPAPLPPPARQSSGEKKFGEQATISLSLLLGLSVLLLSGLALTRRRIGEQLVMSGLLLVLVTLLSLAFYLPSAGHYLFGTRAHLPHFGQEDLVLGCGFLGLFALVVCWWRKAYERPGGARFITGVVGIEGAVAVLLVAQWLYGKALSANRIPIWAGLVVLLAAVWELTMSGESLTNRDTPRLPRATRLFAYFGYLVILSGVVLFDSATKVIATGHLAASSFEPESITQEALFRFGLPVLLLMFLVRQLAGGTKAAAKGALPPLDPEGPSALAPVTEPAGSLAGAVSDGAGAARSAARDLSETR